MVDPSESAEAAASGVDSPNSVRRHRRRLDGRVVGICICIALLGAIGAGLAANALTKKKSGSDSGSLTLSDGKIDGAKLLRTKVLTVDGKTTTLGALAGKKPILVNLWQQSCTPCVGEMPMLDKLHRQDHRVDVIGIDFQEGLGPAKAMAKKTGITYPWYRDPKGVFGEVSQTTALPHSVLIDPSGRILGEKTGRFDSLADTKTWLDHQLP